MESIQNQIPTHIYYCWFGRNPKSKEIRRCIKSWKKYLPNFIIHEINEDNYDITSKPIYVQQAYQAKKWAFVSDYARFDILFHRGGVYFDTDVQIIRPIEDIIAKGSYMGCERDGNGITRILVGPGLGMAAFPGLQVFKEVLESYSSDRFINDDGSLNYRTVLERVTDILLLHGLKETSDIQTVEGITIYPTKYFCPALRWYVKLFRYHRSALTIHWYNASWWSDEEKHKQKIRRRTDRINRIKSMLHKK